MKKNGFTLIELLAVILIMALIVVISTFGINAMRKAINQKMWESKVDLINFAVEKWAEDNKYAFKSASCVDVDINGVLIARGYLRTNEKDSSGNKIITNNTNGQKITGNVQVCLNNGSFYGKYSKE